MFTAPPSAYTFTIEPSPLVHSTAEAPASLPQVPANLGLPDGAAWSEFSARLAQLNRDAAGGASYKLVWAARHGEGYHNVAEAKYGVAEWDRKWSLLTGDGEGAVWGPDPPLTALGEGQARAVRDALQASQQSSDPAPLPTALFASPLQRSAYTAALAYAGTLLAEDGSWNAKCALASPPTIMEGLREGFAERHTCDNRSGRADIVGRWKGWVVEEGVEEADGLFTGDTHETPQQMASRVADALSAIWQRTEGQHVIGITSHSGTMQALFRAVGHPDFKPVPGGLVPMLIKATPRSAASAPGHGPATVASTLGASPAEAQAAFAPGLLSSAKEVRERYETSQPYRHAVVQGLLDAELLKKAREEIIEELRFTEKETDIYKVNQTGDLANLDGLPDSEVSRLGSLLRLRNAIYSEPFRAWLQEVTQCGPLSAKNKDMSINDYRSGCHLLNHDDVIATRRLSYILYLPDPAQDWKPEWGGALELYPTVSRGVPADVPNVVIPPKWNQYTFFTVQPGHSFHSVEEVAHPTHSRLSISGWFHRPQPDEPGFSEEDERREEEERKAHASAEGLSSEQATLPFTPYADSLEVPLPGTPLSAASRSFLAHFLNPAYLQPKTQAQLFEQFGDDSHLLLADFLRPELAKPLEAALLDKDGEARVRWWDLPGGRESAAVPPHSTGVDSDWNIVGPPHRQRYLSLLSPDSVEPATANPELPSPFPRDATALLSLLRTHLFPSPAWRHLLANLTQLVPLAARPIEARRFRPGLDYTLARADSAAVLDVCLGLTPRVARHALAKAGGPPAPKGLAARKAAAKRAKTSTKEAGMTPEQAKDLEAAWEAGDVGGWMAYMPPADDDEEDDPAVYASKKRREREEKGEPADAAMHEEEEVVEMEEDDGEDDEDDGPLLSLNPSWNTLSLALRDEKVARFVKYLSASAGGSRWDIMGEWEIGAVELEEMDEGDD